MVSKEKQKLAQAAQMILDGVEGIMKILTSVELLPGDKRIHPSWIAKYLADALSIAHYLKSPVDTEDGTFEKKLIFQKRIDEFQEIIEKDFKEKGFDYEVEKY